MGIAGVALNDTTNQPSGEEPVGFWARNEFLKHVLSLMTGTAAAQVITFAATLVLGRMYTPAEFGVLTAFMSVTAIITVLATMRYDMAIMLPEHDRQAVVLRRSVTWIAAVLGAIVTLILVFVSRPIAELINAPDAAPWLLLAGLGAFTLAEISALNYWLNRRARYRDMAANRVVQSGATAISQIALWFVKPLGAGGLVVGALIGQIVSILTLRRRTRELQAEAPVTRAESRAALARYKKMPMWNAPTALVDSLRMNGINLAIGAIATGAAMGQFGMAWRIVDVPAVLISSALAQVFFQKLATTPRGELARAARLSVVRSALFGIVPFALVWLLSPWAFPFVLGSEWAEAGLFGQALVPWLFMNLITSPISTIFVVTERQQISLAFSVVYTIVPIAVLLAFQSNVLLAVQLMSLAMGAMLIVNIVLAMLVARAWDRGGEPATQEVA